MYNNVKMVTARKVARIVVSATAFLATAVVPLMVSSSAQAQYYGRGPRLFCSVDPSYRYVRGGCNVGGYGKQPGDYCVCRAVSYGPVVPGVIVAR